MSLAPVACVLLLATALWPVSAAAQRPAPQQPEAPPPIVQPGAPGKPSTVIDARTATDLSKVGFTKADVEFMQGMIHHHQQALEMVALIPPRTSIPVMKLLGQRIELSQQDEISMMQTWLRARGQALPDPHAMHVPGARLMPGMLTADEMQALEAAKGRAFDRLFLEGMIKHHAGALKMVEDLFDTPAAGQDSDIYAFASDVVADQRMEIDRMATMLKELQQ